MDFRASRSDDRASLGCNLDFRSKHAAAGSFIAENRSAISHALTFWRAFEKRTNAPFRQVIQISQEQVMLNKITCDPTAMAAGLTTGRAALDLSPIKLRQHTAWASGDFAVIGTTLQIVGEDLCEALDLRSGQRVLDVAAGNGNAALAAARRWCDVTATDYVPALLDRAMDRALAERLPIICEIADAEALPYANASFDVVTSTFGAMFTPDHEKPAQEMLRVCRPQGKIGLANWTPDGFIGQLFKAIGKYIPPPADMKSPALWGTKEHITELFGEDASAIRTDTRDFMFRYRSDDHWIDIFKTYYGPMLKAFAALDATGQNGLRHDLIALIASLNKASDGTMVVPSEYLEIVITK
jgi:SAM-dependent methyltransferase